MRDDGAPCGSPPSNNNARRRVRYGGLLAHSLCCLRQRADFARGKSLGVAVPVCIFHLHHPTTEEAGGT